LWWRAQCTWKKYSSESKAYLGREGSTEDRKEGKGCAKEGRGGREGERKEALE
jgi:hypothetical protein